MNPLIKDEFNKMETGLDKVIEHFKYEMNGVRAGRANPAVVNRLVVDYYGTPTALSQMANITVPEARVLCISLWDNSMLKAVVKAIQASDIGINPVDDGKTIRLVFPQLTEERRKELVKLIKKVAEESRVQLRNERRTAVDSIKKLKNTNQISEDDIVAAEKDVQKVLDKYMEQLDKLQKEKENEIMEV